MIRYQKGQCLIKHRIPCHRTYRISPIYLDSVCLGYNLPVQLVFREYGWNTGQAGSIQWYFPFSFSVILWPGSTPLIQTSCVFIGGLFGFVSNFHQEHIYHKSTLKNGGKGTPEARLHWAAYGGLLFPLSTYVFAWTGQPSIPWIVPAIFLTMSYWGVYVMYSGVLYVSLHSTEYAAKKESAHILQMHTKRTRHPPKPHRVSLGI